MAAIVIPAAAAGYLVTTFLFAFSGGQYRMVPVVNTGAVAVMLVTLVVAAGAWRLRDASTAVKWTAAATAVAWPAVALVEWFLSFSLGA
jgi:hypothetical protein